MRNSNFKQEFAMRHASAGVIDVTNSSFSDKVDFTGTEVDGYISLGNKDEANLWRDGARLILENVNAGSLVDSKKSWHNLSGRLDLFRFEYKRFGGYGQDPDENLGGRPVDWMLKWLSKQEGRPDIHHPSIYTQLADVLERHGYVQKAEDIRIANRRNQRESMDFGFDKIMSWINEITIGYGYESWKALAGMMVFVVVRAGVARIGITKSGFRNTWDSSSFSLDQAIPFIVLDERNKDVVLGGFVRWYFIVHRVLTFLLATMFLASVSGLVR